MRVGELIEELQRFDPMQTVYIPDCCGKDASSFAEIQDVRPLFDDCGDIVLPHEQRFVRPTNCIGITAGKAL